MIRLSAFLVGAVLAAGALPAAAECPPALDATRRLLASDERVNLCQAYLGKVVLMVNTASKCVYTPQYDGLEQLYDRYRERGLVVLGFPSNDFGGQEPGSEQRIQQFCRLTYKVGFPMLEKTRVIGASADPIYQALQAQTGRTPQWNFHKYLLDRNGHAVASFASAVEPDDPALVEAIEDLLESGPPS